MLHHQRRAHARRWRASKRVRWQNGLLHNCISPRTPQRNMHLHLVSLRGGLRSRAVLKGGKKEKGS